MGSIKNLDAYLGFTVFIDPQLICSSMGKIDDCALLAEFSIVDHHNHTFIGVFARHFHLVPRGNWPWAAVRVFLRRISPLAVLFL